MTNVLLSNLLYKNPTTLPVVCAMRKLGAISPAGIGISKARKGGVAGGAKISAIVLVLDAIIDHRIQAIEGENDIFVTYTRKDGESFACIATNSVPNSSAKWLGEVPDMNWEQLIPFFLLETRTNAVNTELKDVLSKLSREATPYEDDDVFRLCDSFYYGNAQRKTVDIYDNEASLSTVHAAVRSGLLSDNHCVLSQFGCPAPDIEGVKIEKKIVTEEITTESKEKDFDDYIAGKHAITYSWTDEQRSRIPSLKTLCDFVPTAAFWKGCRKISYRTNKILERLDMGLEGLEALDKDVINFFMTGKPGTGKTTIAKALAAAYQLPFYSIPIQKGTEEGTFQGLLKARDGKFVFTSTDFLDAFKNGGVIVLEELNLADPAILAGAIGQAIESPYYVMEDECRPVYRHPLCIIIGTFNVGTAGSKEINPMLSSRFYQTYTVEDPNEDEFKSRLMTFGCNKAIAKKIYTAYSRILDYLKSPDVSALEYCMNVTFRGCVGAVQCLQEGSPFKEAIEDTLIGKIAEHDLELARDVYKNVVETLPD